MIKVGEIRKWCRAVAKQFDPDRIILFGSHAEGTATEDSDADILVVMRLRRGAREVEQAAAIRTEVPAEFPMDLLVRSPQEVERQLALRDGFISGIVRRGRQMYARKYS